MLETQRFKLTHEEADYHRAVEHLANYFGIDLTTLTYEVQDILINYVNYGASAAIMHLINQIQRNGED